MSVPGAIGESFLNNSVDTGSMVFREPVQATFDPHVELTLQAVKTVGTQAVQGVTTPVW